MIFGISDTSNFFWGILFGVSFICACGAVHSSIPQDRMIDQALFLSDNPVKLSDVTLLGPSPKEDKPLSPFCKDHQCYVYTDEEVRVVKKYISALEEKIKELEKRFR